MDDNDLVLAKENLVAASNMVNTNQYRHINGLDKRLAMLEQKLRFLEGSLFPNLFHNNQSFR